MNIFFWLINDDDYDILMMSLLAHIKTTYGEIITINWAKQNNFVKKTLFWCHLHLLSSSLWSTN